jgi:hypothetical protein|tara:strand:- start:2092 stop:2328 length:237 start_codon:yes stop_codon:yes gene_type:complete
MENKTRLEVDKIVNYTTYSNTRKIDSLFEIDAVMYTNLGKESTKTERSDVKSNSKYIYKQINRLDPKLGTLLLKNFED